MSALLCLHPFLIQSGDQFAAASGLDLVAERLGLPLLAPTARWRNWPHLWDRWTYADDWIYDYAQKHDNNLVAVGHSDGGNMLLKLAIRQPWTFRAVVAVGSKLRSNDVRLRGGHVGKPKSHKPPVLLLRGTSDLTCWRSTNERTAGIFLDLGHTVELAEYRGGHLWREEATAITEWFLRRVMGATT